MFVKCLTIQSKIIRHTKPNERACDPFVRGKKYVKIDFECLRYWIKLRFQ